MKNSTLLVVLIFTSKLLLAQSDNCNTATVINLTNGSACVNGTNANATSDNTFYGTCNPGTTLNEVWYTFVASGAQNNFQIDPGTMQDAQIVIYTIGCNGSAGSVLETCEVAVGANLLNTTWGLAPGTQVWIGVMSNSNTDGTFELCIESNDPPPTGGNTCAGAIPICEGTITADISVLGSSGTYPSCFGGAVNQDVWYTFEVLQGGTFEWTATPSGGSTGVELDWALYDISGGCPGSMISCNYNYEGGNNSPNGQVAGSTTNCPINAFNGPPDEFCPPDNLTPGTYAIVVDYYSSSSANTMDFTVGNGTAVIAPVADFSITPNTFVCGPSVTVSINDNSIGIPDWDFGDGTTFTGNNPPDHTYTSPGTYAITAVIGGDCPSTHSEFVELFGPMTAVTDAIDETCPGDCDGEVSVVPSGGSGNYQYSWNPGGQTTPSATGLCPDSYQVTVTDPVCGTNITETAIVGTGACCSMDNLTANVLACNSATNTFSVEGIIEFTQPPTTGQLIIEDCNGNQQILNPPFNSPINYNLAGLNPDGAACNITAFFTADNACTMNAAFTSPSLPLVNAGPDQEVCEGESVVLTASNPDNALIDWNNGISDGVSFNPSVGTNNYIVTADLAGCITTDQVAVIVHPNPVVSAGSDILICEGESVILTGSGADSYIWDNSVTNGITFNPTTTQTYTVTGTTTAGCTGSDEVTVELEAPPNVSFEADIFEGCVPLTVTFTNTTNTPGVDCNWNFSDGSTAIGCNQITHTFDDIGCFDVTLEVTSANGCASSLTESDYICTSGFPIADFEFSPYDLTTLNTNVDFFNLSLGASTYEWNFGDGESSTSVNPSNKFPEVEDTFVVQLIATNDSGCKDTAYAVISIFEELIFYVPNTFTPDEDDFNEVFKPVFTSGFDIYSYKLLIFNRWGEIIFESNNSDVGWNGTYGVGSNEIVKEGTYVWKILFKTSISDERKVEIGHVNVLK